MKTFFIAFILGIFAGSLITAFWSSPEAFEELKAAKNNLFKQSEPVETEEATQENEPVPAEEPPTVKTDPSIPMFKVAPKKEEPDLEKSPTPIPLSEPKPPEDTIERSKEKAVKIAEAVKEKAAELTEQAKPYLNEGVDLAIASAIRAQFKLDKRIASDQLKINVTNREVTLTGTTNSGTLKQLIIEIAMTTKGVMQVTPNIEIIDTEKSE